MKTLNQRWQEVEYMVTESERIEIEDYFETVKTRKLPHRTALLDALITRLEREQVAVKLCGTTDSDDLIENVQGLRMNLDAVTDHYKQMQERADGVLIQCKAALDDARAELGIHKEDDFGAGVRVAADRMRKAAAENRELRYTIGRDTTALIAFGEERSNIRETLEIGDSETLSEGVARVAANFAAFRALVKGIREDARCPHLAGLRAHVRGLADMAEDVRTIFGVLPEYSVQFGCLQVRKELDLCRQLAGAKEGQWLSDRIQQMKWEEFYQYILSDGRRARLDAAHREMTRLHGQIRARQEDVAMLQRTLETNAERRRILEKGLKFYADSKHWNAQGPIGARWFEVTAIEQDMGQVALSALASSSNVAYESPMFSRGERLTCNGQELGRVVGFELNVMPGSSIAHAFGDPWRFLDMIQAPTFTQQEQLRAERALHWQSRYFYGRV